MHIGELISLDRIAVSLAVDTRAEALRAVACSFARDCELDPEAIHEAFEAREACGNTCVGLGVAMPHARIPGLRHAKVAVAICPGGAGYEAPDEEPVRILLALLTESDNPRAGLEALAAAARAIRPQEVRERIAAARSADEVLEILLSAQDAQPAAALDAAAI